MPTFPSSTQPSPKRSPHPVVRWLGRSPSSSSFASHPSDSSELSSRSSSPRLDSLQDALNSSLPTPPPSAHHPVHPSIPPSFLPHRSPPFLQNLTRSTLPTASLSNLPFSPRPYDPPIDTQAPGTPIVVQHSPPERSSIDALRSLRDRAITYFPSTTPTPPPRGPPSHSASFSTSSALSWWFQSENKEHVDELLGEEDRAGTAEEEASKIHKKYLSPTHPIVFCHGLLGFDSVTIGPAIAPLEVTHWRGIKEVLQANGTEVLMTRVPATSSPVDRAKVLEQRIEEAYAGKAVHLIGHSMGGLDCRYLATHLHDHTFTVLSITTLATPHRGSAFADHFLSTVGPGRFPSFLSLLDMLPNGGGDGAAFSSLTIEAMREFNERTPDVPGVKYFSWGAVYEPGLIDTWKWPHSVILEKEGPNDGLVSVESARWGTYLGTLEDVNHLDLVGWINTARYKWASIRGREIKFRPATFYLGVADLLAREVDGVGPTVREDGEGLGGLGRKVAAEGGKGRRRTQDDDPWDAASDGEDER
ncbi:alpha/beta-hydrolase [Artomyces pyxidatus]|uniref:Alpha/beta-hydrolase n=1 Tax=Artomyces pyxidatus TaxID=48021 RepID=A0ACB8TDJ2_9AGAM|nr:alpha/beta-hydrolase [Artomyces pyxidatus]